MAPPLPGRCHGTLRDLRPRNARIGGLSTDNRCCVFNAWLGAAGDRDSATSNLEKTWGAYSSGAEADDNILVFVR
jgi:hypothetical protein